MLLGLPKVTEQGYRLNCFSEAHVVSKDAVHFVFVQGGHPLQTVQLVSLQFAKLENLGLSDESGRKDSCVRNFIQVSDWAVLLFGLKVGLSFGGRFVVSRNAADFLLLLDLHLLSDTQSIFSVLHCFIVVVFIED